jgi:hypothetical protein
MFESHLEEAPTDMNLRHLTFAAAGLGALALDACGGGPTLAVQPAAATSAAQSAQRASADRCDAGRWTGAISPEGRPDGLDAGDAGAVYVWHDPDGWHIRATDRRATDHHYTGTVRVAPEGALTDIRPVRDETDDRVWVVGSTVLHYDFHTFASIDGADFRVTCPVERKGEVERQRLGFHTEFDGHPVVDRVRLGDTKQSPRSADFVFVRAA